ncbi:MAG: MazG nucleotide pyrophosphohydrolase domain-containing protein [Brevinematia bacterium]
MKEFDKLVEIVEVLRSPNGCPWDREQTLESILENIIEEAYEVVNAINQEDFDKIKDETGDLILQAVFISQIAKELKKFSIENVLENLNNKLIYRHPHVFQNEALPKNVEEALKVWESRKKESNNILDEIPQNLPTLLYIYKVIQKSKRKNILKISEREILNNITKTLENFDLSKNEDIETLTLLLLTLLSYRNVRTEVNLRKKFLSSVKELLENRGNPPRN